jgi:hypothetical protein
MRALETAFSPQRAASIPPEVLQTLLALAEFMEHDEKPLPIDIRKLGAVAENCQARHPHACSAMHFTRRFCFSSTRQRC